MFFRNNILFIIVRKIKNTFFPWPIRITKNGVIFNTSDILNHDAGIWKDESYYKSESYIKMDSHSIALLQEVKQNNQKEARILDIFCNIGRHINDLQQNGFKNIYGFDIMKPAIAKMADVFPNIDREKIKHCNIYEYFESIEDNYFDYAYTNTAGLELIHPSYEIINILSKKVKKGITVLLNDKQGYPRYWKYIFIKNGFILKKAKKISSNVILYTFMKEKKEKYKMFENVGNMSKEQQVRNAGIYMFPTIVSIILPIISLPIILRSLSPAEYGAYALSLAFASVVVGFCQLSLLDVFERNFFIYKTDKERAQLLFTIISFVSSIMFVAGIVIYFFKGYLAAWIIQNKVYGLMLLCTFVGQTMQTNCNYYLSFLKNIGNAKLNVSIIFTTSLLSVILNIYFVSILKIGPIGLALGLLISNTIIFLIITIYFITRIKFSLYPSILISSLKLSLPLVPTNFLSIVGKQFDKYIISVITSVGGAGIYAISQRISGLSFLFMTSIHKVYGPIVYHRMFNKNSKDGGKEIGQYLTPFAYFSVSAALIVSLFSEEALIILAPPEYIIGLGIINIICISYSFSFFTKQPQIMYAGKTIVLSLLTFINFIITIVITYICVNKFGLLGAAIGYFITTIIYNSIYLWQGQKYYKIHYEWIKIIAIYSFLIFSSLTVIQLYQINISYVYRLIIKIIYMLAYLGLGAYLKIITRSNFKLILNIFKSTSSIQV